MAGLSTIIIALGAGYAIGEIRQDLQVNNIMPEITQRLNDWSEGRHDIFQANGGNYDVLPLESPFHAIVSDIVAEKDLDLSDEQQDQIALAIAQNKDIMKRVPFDDGFFAKGDFSGYNFNFVNTTDANFTGANFEGANFGISSHNSDFTDAHFTSARIASVTFSGSVLHGVDFSNARIFGSDFVESSLTGAILNETAFGEWDPLGQAADNPFISFDLTGKHNRMSGDALNTLDFSSSRGLDRIDFYDSEGREIVGLGWKDGQPVPRNTLLGVWNEDKKILFEETNLWSYITTDPALEGEVGIDSAIDLKN